jgi:hypothetical protein
VGGNAHVCEAVVPLTLMMTNQWRETMRMNAESVIEYLQSIAILAVRAQEAIQNGDSTTCNEILDLIEGDVAHVRAQLS